LLCLAGLAVYTNVALLRVDGSTEGNQDEWRDRVGIEIWQRLRRPEGRDGLNWIVIVAWKSSARRAFRSNSRRGNERSEWNVFEGE
jgi:hypothetical protein